MLSMDDVPGNDRAKGAIARALEADYYKRRGVALVSPHGIGPTAIARRIPSIIGEPTDHQKCWLDAEREGAGMRPMGRWDSVPFRAPHHTVSERAIVQEVRLARFGVLFLDELHSCRLATLQELARAHRGMYGAPLIVGSLIPCPCGYHGSMLRSCSCSADRIARWAGWNERVTESLGITELCPVDPIERSQLAYAGGGW